MLHSNLVDKKSHENAKKNEHSPKRKRKNALERKLSTHILIANFLCKQRNKAVNTWKKQRQNTMWISKYQLVLYPQDAKISESYPLSEYIRSRARHTAFVASKLVVLQGKNALIHRKEPHLLLRLISYSEINEQPGRVPGTRRVAAVSRQIRLAGRRQKAQSPALVQAVWRKTPVRPMNCRRNGDNQ